MITVEHGRVARLREASVLRKEWSARIFPVGRAQEGRRTGTVALG